MPLPHPGPSPEEKSDRSTLHLRSPAEQTDTPELKKRGRGWEISEKRLDVLHERARAMRRAPSPAHKALAAKFAGAELGRHTFKRHAVVGSAIVDFHCPTLSMAVMLSEEGDDPAIATRRDKSLEAVGTRVMRLSAADVLADLDAALARIAAGMRHQLAERKSRARAHAAANPKQHYGRPQRPGRPAKAQR